MEEFDLDEIAELNGLLQIAELENEENQKKVTVSEEVQNSNEVIVTKTPLEDLNETFPGLENYLNLVDLKKFRDFIGHLSTIYGNSWDISPSPGSNATARVYIHFKEVNVTNSKNHSHTLKDFFIHFVIGKNIELIGSFKGLRTTLSLKETNYGYSSVNTNPSSYDLSRTVFLHSHLKGTWIDFKSVIPYTFCLGSSELASNLSYLQNENYCMQYWLQGLLLLEPLVRWESLEGVPYREIIKLTRQQSSNIFDNLIRFRFDSSYNYISSEKLNSYDVNLLIEKYIKIIGYSKGELKVSLKKDELLKDCIETIESPVSSNLAEHLISKIVYYSIEGRSLTVNQRFIEEYRAALAKKLLQESATSQENVDTEKVVYTSTDFLTFKGEKIYPKVIGDSTVENSNVTLLDGSFKVYENSPIVELAKIKLFNVFLRENYKF